MSVKSKEITTAIKYLIAGKRAEADHWARQWGWKPKEWRYVHSPLVLKGLRVDPKQCIRFIGTWYLRPDADEIRVEYYALVQRSKR